MGGSSTSHAVLRGKKDSSSSAFDLHSWEGLTQVLKVGKESLKDSGSYGEFRDLVLQYAQQGGDVELRKKIDAIVATFGQAQETPPSHGTEVSRKIEVNKEHTTPDVVVPEKKEEPVIAHEVPQNVPPIAETTQTLHTRGGFIQRRPQPQFKAPVTHVVQVEAAPREVVLPPIPKDTPMPPPVPEAIPSVISETKNESSLPSFLPKQESLVAESVPVPEAQPTVPKTVEEYRARIAEIKRTVHASVGNPAALIDTHNVLGKKYMSALLSALKATGGGSNLDVENEMRKLEDATTALLEESKEGTGSVKTTSAPVQNIAQEAPAAAKEEEKAPIIPEPVISSVNEPVVVEKETVEPHTEKEKIEEVPSPVKEEIVEAKPIVVREEPVVRNTEVPVPKPPVEVVPEASEVSVPKPISNPLGSIPEKIDLAHAATPIQQAELATPEITQALHQLLHEWSIFDGSGFLGIGPGGSDHPLYKKLSALSMGEVLAGRWEDSDPKITKNIKQYVDAWRHEQGIAYTINETFEHYLRRVVQRILKRQI